MIELGCLRVDEEQSGAGSIHKLVFYLKNGFNLPKHYLFKINVEIYVHHIFLCLTMTLSFTLEKFNFNFSMEETNPL